jgi:hypothetical protein
MVAHNQWLPESSRLDEVLDAFMPNAEREGLAARAELPRGGMQVFQFAEDEADHRFIHAPRLSGVPFHLYVKPAIYRGREIRPLLDEPRAMRPLAGAYAPDEHWMLDAVISDMERGSIPFALFLDRAGICVYRRC